nr:S-layer homology domain-containing protein [Bacillota bacterium]
MKIFRKLILCCFVLAMYCSNTVAAGITCYVENNHLLVSGDLGDEYAYRMIALQLNGPFLSETKFPDAVENTDSEFKKLEHTEFVTLYLDENGKFRHSFYPGAGNCFYAVAAFCQGFEKPWSSTVLNVPDDLETEVLALINDAQSAEDIKAIYDNSNYHNALTYNYSFLKNITKEENLNLFYRALYQSKQQEPITNLEKSYIDIMVPISVVMNINEMSGQQTEEARLIAEQNMDLETAPLYNFYNDMANSQKQNVFKRLLGVNHSDVEEFLVSFDTAIFLQRLENEVFKNNLTALLNDNASNYNINLNGYSANTEAVNNAIYSKYFKTAQELSDAIAAAVAGATSNTGGGASGGSSGGSSFNGGFLPAIDNRNLPTPILSEIFDDLESVLWAKDAIEALYKLGVISGRGEKVFDPGANVKREEFLKMILIAANKPMDGDAVAFTDVDKEAWY